MNMFHPTTNEINDSYGCRTYAGAYEQVDSWNLYNPNGGYFPTLEAGSEVLQAVVVGLLGYEIVPRHPLQALICDASSDCGGWYEMRHGTATICTYALWWPWTRDRLQDHLAHEIAHYLEEQLTKHDPLFLFRWPFSELTWEPKWEREEFAKYFERNFPQNKDFCLWLAGKWRDMGGSERLCKSAWLRCG